MSMEVNVHGVHRLIKSRARPTCACEAIRISYFYNHAGKRGKRLLGILYYSIANLDVEYRRAISLNCVSVGAHWV